MTNQDKWREVVCGACGKTVVNPQEDFACSGGMCLACTAKMEAAYELTPLERRYVRLLRPYADRFHTLGHGPDPYVGEIWTVKIGKLRLQVGNLVCDTIELSWGHKTLYRKCETDFKQFGPVGRTLFGIMEALERDYQERHCGDEYGSLAYYE